MEKHDIYAPLDPEIAPLIQAMRRHRWLDTVSSCFGHEGHEFHTTWHVAFWCRKSALPRLVAVLADAGAHYPTAWILELSLVWQDAIANCQTEAEPDCLSLHLAPHDDEYLSLPERLRLTSELAAAFDRA